jgi:aconitate hydratase
VRVTVPRTLPTDDVLILRKGKGKAKGELEGTKAPPAKQPKPEGWKKSATLSVVDARTTPSQPSAMVLPTLDSVRWAARHAAALGENLRAVVAEYIPSGLVPLFAGLGIVALTTDAATLEKLGGEKSLELPAADKWNGQEPLKASAGKLDVTVAWRAVDAERQWTAAGTAKVSTPLAKGKG